MSDRRQHDVHRAIKRGFQGQPVKASLRRALAQLDRLQPRPRATTPSFDRAPAPAPPLSTSKE